MATQNSMMLAERTDELLNRGRSQGFLSTEEVANLLQEGDLSAAEVEEFYAALEEEEISIVDSEAAEAGGAGRRQLQPSTSLRLLRSRSHTPSPRAIRSGCTWPR